jgi:hypothetical protein
MMGGVSPETCWASCKYEIKFWYNVASCWIFYVNYTMMNGSTNIKSLNKVSSKMQQIWTYNFNKYHYPCHGFYVVRSDLRWFIPQINQILNKIITKNVSPLIWLNTQNENLSPANICRPTLIQTTYRDSTLPRTECSLLTLWRKTGALQGNSK